MALYPESALYTLESDVRIKAQDQEKYNVIQRSEFYETLGIAQFFGARYTQCLASFETAIRIKQLGHNKELTYHRNIGRMALLGGIACYRKGEFHSAQAQFEYIVSTSLAKQYDPDLYCIAASNLALIYLHLLKPNDAKESAENAVNTCREYLEHPLGPFRTQKENETADASHELEKEKEKDKHKEKKHGAGGGSGSTAIKKKGKHAHKAKKQQELPSAEAPLKPNTENLNITDHLRTLFLVYIRTNQQNAAQDVLNKNVKHFPAKEFQLLNAGCNIARSNFDKALESLMVAAAIQKKERSKLKGLPSASGLFQDGSKSVEAVGAMSGDKKSSGKASELSTNTGTNISTATLKSCDANVRAFQDRVSEMQQHVAQYEAEMTNDLHDSMIHFNIAALREYQLNTRDKTKDALILDQIVPSTEIRAVSGAGEDPTHENVEDPRDVKIVSSIAHFHRAAELLCDIKSKLKAEKEYFAMHAEESTSQSLLTCSIPDDTLTSLVALSYMALAGVEMSLSNIMFVDGLHLQHGEIMKEILSVLHQSDQESANDENSFHSHDKTERVDKFRGKRKHSSKSGAKFPHATDKNDPYAAIDVFHKHHRPTLPTIMKSKQNPTLRQLDSSGTVIGARSAVAVNSSPDAHLIMDTSSPAPFISEFMGTDYHLGRGLRADGSGARAVKELLANDAVDATGLAHTMKSSSASPSPSRSYSCDTTTELDAELSAEVYAHGHGSNKITKDMYPYIRHFQAGHNKEHYNNTMLLNQQRHFDIMKSVLALLDYSFVLMQDALAYNGPNGIAHSKRLADVAPSVPSSARESKFLFPDSVLDPGSTAPPSVAPSGGSTPSVVTPIRSMGGNSLSTPKRSSIVGRNKKGLPPIPINIDTTISEYVVENHRVLLAILTNKFDEACTHVAHMLKKKFGHVVPGRLGEKKKIAITANHGCRTQAASATFSSVVAANVKEHDQKLNSNATVNASMTVASTTLKEYHDLYEQVSVRSEIFPIGTLIENAIENDEEEDGNNSKEPIVNYTFSVDEFSYWLQWGLLITDVPGYGYMTFSCHQQLENLGHLNQDIIKEVFSNLARLYNELKADISHKSVMYGCIYNSCHKLTHVEDEYDINHRNSNLGLKIVFVSALCKLSAYLENYSDLAMYISEYTALSEILNDYTHLALSHRYQLDFEEFDFQSENQHMGNENRRTMPELTKSLKIAKKYVHYSGYTNDFHLKRDALKKLMNMYLEIYSIADTIKGKHNHTLSSRANHLHMKDSANEAIMEELSNLSIEAVDAKEIADPNWLMKVSKMRAKVIMHRIKELSSVCS